MDIGWSEAEEAFRAEVRGWLEANKPPLPMPSGDSAAGVGTHLEWERKLFDARWAVVSWPESALRDVDVPADYEGVRADFMGG